MSIAETIRNQIGRRAFFMIGGKNLTGTPNSLRFSCMRNAKKVCHIEVRLDPSDTYTVIFANSRGRVLCEVDDVYVESLHRVIESNTGLCLSL